MFFVLFIFPQLFCKDEITFKSKTGKRKVTALQPIISCAERKDKRAVLYFKRSGQEEMLLNYSRQY